MRKIELTIVLIISLSSNLFANNDDMSKSVASVLGFLFVYGIILLVRKSKKKDN